MNRKRLSTKQREALYLSEVEKARAQGLGDQPRCNICQLPVAPGQLWDASHDPHSPRWLSQRMAEAIAHRRCNRLHNNARDTPAWAKSERIRKAHLDLKRSRTPLPGGRDDQIKKTMRGEVVDRRTGEPWGGWK